MGGATSERARFWRQAVDSYQMSVVSKSSVCDTSEVRFTRHKLTVCGTIQVPTILKEPDIGKTVYIIPPLTNSNHSDLPASPFNDDNQ